MTGPNLETFETYPHVTAAALRGDSMWLIASDELIELRLRDGHTDRVRAQRLPAAAARVAVSSSGRFAVTVDSERAIVWDGDGCRELFEVPASDPRWLMPTAFARLAARELLVCGRERSIIAAFELPAGTLAFTGALETFLADSFVASVGGAHLAAVGYFAGEGKDSLAVIPAQELAEPADVLFARFRRKLPIADYAHRLAVGPCGADAFVVFRDPEDDEDDKDVEDDGREPDTTGTAISTADVRGHRGFYARSLDGTLRWTRVWDGPLASFARIAASAAWIAAECKAEVAVVSVAGAVAESRYAARWLAAAPDGVRILVQMRDGALGMLSLPR